MDKTLFEANWHYVEDKFSHCTVTPIKVIREGVLPGCSGVSITAIDSKGEKFQGAPGDYFDTEAAAWADVKMALTGTIEANGKMIAELAQDNERIRAYLLEKCDA